MAEQLQLDKPMLLPPQASKGFVNEPPAPPTGPPAAPPAAQPPSAAHPSAAPPSAFKPVVRASTAPLAVKQHSRLSMVSKHDEEEENSAGSVDPPKQADFSMAGQVLQGQTSICLPPDTTSFAMICCHIYSAFPRFFIHE